MNVGERVRSLFRRVPDSELEQGVVRIVMAAACFLYLFFVPDGGGPWPYDKPAAYNVFWFYMFGSLLLAAEMLRNPRVVPRRRFLALVLDSTAACTCMIIGAQYGMVIFGNSLWNCLGFGLRYGKRYLRAAQVFNITAFVIAIAFSEFWRAHLQLAVALLVTLYFVPEYAAKLLDRLTRAKQLAEQANQAKSRFVSAMSHEVRTPLNGIIAANDLLKGMSLSAEQQELVGTIDVSGRALLSLLNDLLDLNRIEAGKLSFDRVPFQVQTLVDQTLQVVTPLAVSKGLYLRSDVDVAWERFEGDPVRIAQVLLNLVSNAVKFTDSGGVTVRVRDVVPLESSPRIRFEVIDTGIGIAPEHHARVFDSFTQLDASPSRRFGGAGLGTTIAKELVEKMGGGIGLASEVGEGSTFWFELPLMPTSQAPLSLNAPTVPAQHGAAPVSPSAGPTAISVDPVRSSRRILLVEDNAVNRHMAEKILTRAGHLVSSAESGRQALEMLAHYRFDAVIADMEMPGMSGVELVREYQRCADEPSALHWIILTANATPEARAAFRDTHVSTFLTKPIDTNRLLTEVANGATRAPPDRRADLAQGQDELLDRIKVNRLLAEVDGPEFLEELTRLFEEDGARIVAELEGAIEARDPQTVLDLLHALSGTAAEVGATLVEVLCKKLRRAPADVIDAGPAVVTELQQAVRDALIALRLSLRLARNSHPVASG